MHGATSKSPSRGSLAKPPVTKLWSNLDSNKKRVEPNYDLLIVFLTGINVGKNWPPIKIHLATVIAVSKMVFSGNFRDKLFARLKRGNRSSWGAGSSERDGWGQELSKISMIFFGDIDLLQSFIDANALVKGDQRYLAAIISNPILLKRN